ncbi:hypothetical protein BH10PLA2_BH10PLA2_04090 [soil metagenome]
MTYRQFVLHSWDILFDWARKFNRRAFTLALTLKTEMTAKLSKNQDGVLSASAREELDALNQKIRALLPGQYVHCYESVSPDSMGTAKLKYNADGTVAWDEIWTSFCHLALAGGPPHRGRLLASVPETVAQQQMELTNQVSEEIERGLFLAADLRAARDLKPGWVGARCRNEAMAAWMTRAVVAENIFARQEGDVLLLPAGPDFRLEKEIKNVITAVAKTSHYWSFHAAEKERSSASKLFKTGGTADPIFAPATVDEVNQDSVGYQEASSKLEKHLAATSSLEIHAPQTPGWIGLKCTNEEMAIWLMRAAIAENLIARREEAVLFLPVNPPFASENLFERYAEITERIWRAWNTNIMQSKEANA